MITRGPSAGFVPVSPERHGGRRWQRFASYAFVRDYPQVPIVIGEHEQVAATLPIAFAHADQSPWPVALTRLGDETGLVAANGAWRGAYVPSILRVYPFTARKTDAGQFALLVDETSGLVTDGPEGEPFFDPAGTLAAPLAEVVAFFRQRVAQEEQTRAAMRALDAARVLVPFGSYTSVALPTGLYSVDPTALSRLARSDLSALHHTGALGIIHAALVSRHHLALLAHAEAALDAPPKADPVTPAAPDTALTGFFDALASSQSADPELSDLNQSLEELQQRSKPRSRH